MTAGVDGEADSRDAISTVSLRTVLNSRGDKTVEATVETASGGRGSAIAPSGASTGEYEAIELPADEAILAAREKAVPELLSDVDARNQPHVDRVLREVDGTDDFSAIGANSTVAISMAAAKAAADTLGVPLFKHLGGTFSGTDSTFPVPLGNVVGGGAHAADSTYFQEFLAAPVGASSMTEAVFANATVHREVGAILNGRGIPASKGDEGGWAPAIDDAEAFDIVREATNRVEDEVGFEVGIGIDPAASELYDADADVYRYGTEERTPDEQVEYVARLVDEFDLVYVEDPLDENDYEGFAALTARVGDRTLVCGDDLFVTNVERLRVGVEMEAGNSILIKPNQIGTLSDTVNAMALATRSGYKSVVSHRSGETEDTTIAHLAVATGAPFIKAGAVGGERTAKLNELIRIDETVRR